jgi:hypothetical protein
MDCRFVDVRDHRESRAQGEPILRRRPIRRMPSAFRIAVCLLSMIASAAGAATIENPALLPGGDGGGGDRFGTALALAGDTLIVGVPNDNPNGLNNSGSAYVFTRVDGVWTYHQRLNADDSASGHLFGFSVALHGDTLIVGAPSGGSANQGAAYVFERSAGQFAQQQKLVVPALAQPRNFGWSVAAGPEVVWAGSPSHHVTGAFQGSATQFKREGGVWQQGPTFGPFNGTGGETFGIAMAYSDGHLIVGERGEDVGAQFFAGAAIAYRYDGTLAQLNIFSAPGVQSFDQFGAAIAVDDDLAVVGAPSNMRPGYAQVFRFEGTQWLADGLPLSLGPTGFGYAVAIDGERIAVGGLAGAGLVQIYERIEGQWTARALISPPDLIPGDDFGASTVFDGLDVIVGLPGRDLAGVATDVGEARTFPAPPEMLHRDGFE